MEINGSVSNPMLVGAIELLKADGSDEHKQLFVNEMMKAKFLTPASITPMPAEDAEGKRKLTAENKVQFPMLTASDGKHFFMAFSDKREMEKWDRKEDAAFAAVTLSMEEYMAMVLRKGSAASGCVINPYGANIVIPREMMAPIFAARLAKMKELAEARKKPE